MTPQEMQQLAELLQTVPGIKSLDLKDVRRLAQLLRESPEIGSIEVKGWFGTGLAAPAAAAPLALAAAAPAGRAAEHAMPGAPAAHPAPGGLKEIRSPMVG